MNANSITPRDRLDPAGIARRMSKSALSPESGFGCKKNVGGCGCDNENNGCGNCGLSDEYERAEYESKRDNRQYDNDDLLCGNALAMIYSPYQRWQNLYDEEEGFCRGTIFKELDKPFYGPKCNGGGCNG